MHLTQKDVYIMTTVTGRRSMIIAPMKALSILSLIVLTPLLIAQEAQTKGSVSKNYVVAEPHSKIVVNGRAWQQAELRPAWAAGPRSERHSQNQVTQTHVQQSRVALVSSRHRSRKALSHSQSLRP